MNSNRVYGEIKQWEHKSMNKMKVTQRCFSCTSMLNSTQETKNELSWKICSRKNIFVLKFKSLLDHLH